MRALFKCVLVVSLTLFAASPAMCAKTASRTPTDSPNPYTFNRGVVVNHWLSDNLPATMLENAHYGANWFDSEDMAWIADHGFDDLRIWVSGHEWVDASGHLIDSKIEPFERALRDARAEGLGVVLVMHSLPRYRATIRGEPEPANAGSPFTDASVRREAENLWRRVAERFSAHDEQLRFELINQPNAENIEQMRAFNKTMLAAIRAIDTHRIVYIGGRRNDAEFIDDAVLSDPNTALTLSFREPGIFAYQYLKKIPVITFPGNVPNLHGLLEADDPWLRFSNTEVTIEKLETQIQEMAEQAKRVAGEHEVYVNNIGVMTFRTDSDSIRTYMRTIRTSLERQGLSWAVYDYHTGCAVRADAGAGGPTAVLEGLGLLREPK